MKNRLLKGNNTIQGFKTIIQVFFFVSKQVLKEKKKIFFVMSMVGQMSSGSLNAQEVTAEYRCIGNEYLRMLQFRQVGEKKELVMAM